MFVYEQLSIYSVDGQTNWELGGARAVVEIYLHLCVIMCVPSWALLFLHLRLRTCIEHYIDSI